MLKLLAPNHKEVISSFMNEEARYKIKEIISNFDESLRIEKATTHGCLEMIKWLRQHGAP